MKLIEGKKAFITGGGRGIGKAVAIEFAKNGADVAITARSESELNETVQEIEKFGVKGLAIPADLSTVEGVNTCADKYLNSFKICDILVNNAGYSQYHSVLEYPVEDFQYLFNLNVMSYFLMTKRMLPGMLEQKSGKVIFTSSGAGTGAFPAKKFAYAATKAAEAAMGRCIHAEFNSQGIDVNVVCPGLVETKIAEYNRQWGALYPEGEPPKVIAPMYLFLASNTIKRPYKGRVIDEFSFSELLLVLKKNIESTEFNVKDLLKSMKEKLRKDMYTLFRKNQELAEFMLKYE